MNPLRRRLVGTFAGSLALARGSSVLAAAPGYSRLMEGPMVGAVTPDSFTLWARAGGELPLAVEYSVDPLFAATRVTVPVTVSSATDYTARLTVPGLQPATRYYYRVRVDDGVDRYRREPFSVRTAPAGPASFRVAFGSCARRALDPEQAIFRSVALQSPDLFFWLGDNIYGDTAFQPVLQEEYRKQREVLALQPLLRSVPQLATWDDHDFGLNNSDRTNPVREGALAAFRNYWANPQFGLPDTPGVFFKYAYGGVDFFFLDGRYYRDPGKSDPGKGPDGVTQTMLGAGQKQWLKEALRASRAPFKVLICGSGWSSEDGPQGDTWGAFLTERTELLEFIRDHDISGVFCLSGYTHFGEINCIAFSEQGGYDVYDLVSSPLAQPTGTAFLDQEPEMRIRSPYFRSCNFGQLDFRFEPEPTVIFTLRDLQGVPVWQPLTLRASELRNRHSSWADKIDAAELKRRSG